ncbi:MAG: hypothetical protein ACRD03_11460 [Acidimicrobiales bacterium]
MHARTFPTKSAASRWSKEMETDLSRGDWIDPRLARTTFGAWAKEHLATIVRLRAVTRGDYERQLRVHILPAFQDAAIAQISHVDVRRFIAELRAAGLAPQDAPEDPARAPPGARDGQVVWCHPSQPV